MLSSPAFPSLICIGNSHLKSVAEAANDRGRRLTSIILWGTQRPVTEVDGEPRWRDDIRAQLGSGPIFSLIGGCAHHVVGLLSSPRPFDFVLPSAPDLPATGDQLVPVELVRTALLDLIETSLSMMMLLARTQPGPVFHVEPPPVSADEERMSAGLRALPVFKKGGTLSPRIMHYKLWRLHSEILLESCHEAGIRFLPHPHASVDPNGFLLPEYYEDPMHANAAYGALVLDQMEECLERACTPVT